MIPVVHVTCTDTCYRYLLLLLVNQGDKEPRWLPHATKKELYELFRVPALGRPQLHLNLCVWCWGSVHGFAVVVLSVCVCVLQLMDFEAVRSESS